MHTTHDYVTKEPKLWIIHNPDFSGEVYVRWKWFDDGQEQTLEWVVDDGEELLSGNFQGNSFFTLFDTGKKLGQVPPWVVGRAVSVAIRYHMRSKIVGFVEQF